MKKFILFSSIFFIAGCNTEKIVAHQIQFDYPYVGSYNIQGKSSDGDEVEFKLFKHSSVKSKETINCFKIIFKTQNNAPITKNCIKDENQQIKINFRYSDFDYPQPNKKTTIYFMTEEKKEFSTNNKKIITATFHTINEYDGPQTRLMKSIGNFLRGLYAAR